MYRLRRDADRICIRFGLRYRSFFFEGVRLGFRGRPAEHLELQAFAAARFDDLEIDILQHQPIHQITGQEFCVARLCDLDLAQHLAEDDLKVLVVRINALRAINLLHLRKQVALHSLAPLNPENIVRV